MKSHTDTSQRFHSKTHPADNGCVEWIAAKDWKGYGRFYVNGHHMGAHRWAYMESRGPIPGGLQVDHLCRNRSCVNPDHMELVTRRENILRGESPSARAARKTRCDKGHEFTGSRRNRRERVCLECARKRYFENKLDGAIA